MSSVVVTEQELCSNPRHERPELLSPAGDWDALKSAVANGADAVYFGLSEFNARHRATNFTVDELPNVIGYLHAHNVKGYVTCNTLIFSDELPEMVRYLTALAKAGVDAVIVQDLGIVRLIRRLAPQLVVHGSTQMTLTDTRGVNFVRRLGVERAILARELSIPEIRQIATETQFPIEVFIHGALCVAYSGQCLTSESLGGRSANRGQCAQACRLPYDLIVDGEARDLSDIAYLLSPQDLAAPDLVHEMVEAGVGCFKIEGRLKSAQYVAATTMTYRAALDAALQGRDYQLDRQQSLTLQQTFSRGFSHGFLRGVDHQELVHGRFPKSRGVAVGRMVQRTADGVVVELHAQHLQAELEPSECCPVKPGDGIVFDEGRPEEVEQGGRVFQVRFRGQHRASPRFELTFRSGTVDLNKLSEGALVWKTDDPEVRKRLEQTYSRDEVHHRIPVSAVIHATAGEPLRIEYHDPDGCVGVASSEQLLEVARKVPLSTDGLQEQIGRLGDTPFELGSLELRSGGAVVSSTETVPVMVPRSLLNEVRRQAVAELLAMRAAGRRRDRLDPDALGTLRNEIRSRFYGSKDVESTPNSPLQSSTAGGVIPRLTVLVRTLEQLDAVMAWLPEQDCPPVSLVYCDFEEVKRYAVAVEKARGTSLPLALATLRVVKPKEDGWLRQIGNLQPDYVLVRNLSALAFYQQNFPGLRLLGDYSLNVANELTAAIFRDEGIERLVPSYDLNWQQLQALLERFPAQHFEAVVHQHMPMFHMEHCVFAHTLSDGKDYRDCGRPCDHHQVDLRDRVGENHPLVADAGCRNTLFNAHAQSAVEYLPRMRQLGLSWFRVELLRESAEETAQLLGRYSRVLAGRETGRNIWQQLQILNQLGVTRGPLDFQ